MTHICDLNPVPSHDIGGTDLMIPFVLPSGDVGFLAGDTFSGDGPYGPPMPGIGNWRSPVLLRTHRVDPSKPIEFKPFGRDGQQLWDYQHNNGTYTTVLPCDAITIGQRIYAWVMFTNGLMNEQWCEVRASDDNGISWHRVGDKFWAGAFESKRVMISWAKDPSSDYIHIISTGGLARNKDMLLWRTNEAGLGNPHAWEGWGWNGHDWAWGRYPTSILPGWQLGEICLRYIDGQAVISGFDAGDYSIFVKVGDRIDNTNWITARTYRPVTGLPRGVGTVPRLYGGYVHPYSRFEDGRFCMIVSQWAESGNPYRAMQFVFNSIRGVRPHSVIMPEPFEPVPGPGVVVSTPEPEPVVQDSVQVGESAVVSPVVPEPAPDVEQAEPAKPAPRLSWWRRLLRCLAGR
jgi:hypothetical protein